ncbi:hypothetical protein Btru_070386 [Bulinus truncatus]|nr:hypothetical protein Btru_070386 [Bulinus truncatus]
MSGIFKNSKGVIREVFKPIRSIPALNDSETRRFFYQQAIFPGAVWSQIMAVTYVRGAAMTSLRSISLDLHIEYNDTLFDEIFLNASVTDLETLDSPYQTFVFDVTAPNATSFTGYNYGYSSDGTIQLPCQSRRRTFSGINAVSSRSLIERFPLPEEWGVPIYC